MKDQLWHLATAMRCRLASDRGATMVEYALLVALIAVALLGALSFFADERVNVWDRVGKSVHG